MALVGGEAGSGKSRLVREFAYEVAGEGVLVLYGACDAVVRSPYRPFVEALDHLVQATGDLVRADLGPAGVELTRLLPDLALRIGELGAPITADPDTERHRLHTAVTDVLTNASRRRPLMLVLEDGHWADTPTLLLLRHLARAVTDARILVLATFRDTEADVPAELADALTELRRYDDVVRLRLGGLNEREIAEFLRSASGATVAVAPELARRIRDLTEGNPFLLCELWRMLAETEAFEIVEGTVRLTRRLEEIATPESIREVVRDRVSRLPPPTRDLLDLASVAGPEFELETLRRAAPHAGNLSLEGLEPAERSGLIEEIPSRQHRVPLHARTRPPGALRPAQRAPSGRAAPLRRRGARGSPPFTGRTCAGRPRASLHRAATLGGRERAITYNLLAAEAATPRSTTTKQPPDCGPPSSSASRASIAQAEVWLELGAACVRAGESLESIHAYREAGEIARAFGTANSLRALPLGSRKRAGAPACSTSVRSSFSKRPPRLSPPVTRCSALAFSPASLGLAAQGDHLRGAVVRRNAIEMARRIDDRQGLATVLMHAYWARGATPLEDVLEMVTESRDLAAQIGDVELHAQAMEWRVPPLMALGDVEAARQQLATVTQMAQRVRQPFILYVAEQYNSALALLEGRFRDAEAAAERSREWGRLLRGREASGSYGIQMFAIRREQGRLAELAPAARSLAAAKGGDGAWRPAFAALLAELGMHEEVERQLAHVRREGLDSLRRSLWLASLIYLTDACSAIGDENVAALIYPELLPFAGMNLVIGGGVVFYGAADRYLGMLAATSGETERADGHFAAALELEPPHVRDHVARAHLLRVRTDAARERRARACRFAPRRGRGSRGAGRDANTGRPHPAPRPARAKTRRFPHGLTEREADVLRLVARALSNREIGAALSISEHTVANHVKSILRKTGCANRTEAASYAYRRGLVES